MINNSQITVPTIDDVNLKGKKVLVRLDINCPIDGATKKIVNENRLKRSINTLKKLILQEAKIAIIAHQGDTLDYQNLIPLEEHGKLLSLMLGHEIKYIDDVCGIEARNMVNELKEKEVMILGNLRYLTEEVSTFENNVDMSPEEMKNTWIIRRLGPLFDYYINDAFSAAHRNSPSMVAFQEILPTLAGEQYCVEYNNLSKLINDSESPVLFILGGAKISDAFGMIEEVLSKRKADFIATTGVVGMIFLEAHGIDIGDKYRLFLKSKGLLSFIKKAAEILNLYQDKILFPEDVAYLNGLGKREEISVNHMKELNEMYIDIGNKTISKYENIIEKANTIFMNGPAGIYEDEKFELGTKNLFKAVANSKAFSVIGGGDTVTAANKYININDISYVSTAGGAMIQFISGKELPLIKAMNKAFKKYKIK